jgi:NAD(P)-dependent dehydrogenase (short-subunit alcohol dehydrogenase family)
VVTGATSGLGLAAAEQLAAQGAHVVVVGRHPDRCAAAAERITGEALVADLSRQDEVRRLAEEIAGRHPRVHVLVNNAGTVSQRRRLTADGLELTFAVNHLAPFLLTRLLREALVAGAPARVVNVTSVAHERERLDFDDLQCERGYRPFPVYARSKLANLLFTYELARRWDGAQVTANAVHPGLVDTRLGDKAGLLARVVWRAIHLRYRRVSVAPQEGARTIVQLATAPDLTGVSGRYFAGGREAASSAYSRDPEVAARLWEASERLTAA